MARTVPRPVNVFGAAPVSCPCGTGLPYAACCEPLHLGAAQAETAEALMRSRYAAHATARADHLLRTWHPRTRPSSIDLDPRTRWVGLDIVATSRGGVGDDSGVVEFRARYLADGRAGELHEVSHFERRGGRWLYVDGVSD